MSLSTSPTKPQSSSRLETPKKSQATSGHAAPKKQNTRPKISSSPSELPSTDLQAKYDMLSYASFQLVHEELVRMTSLKLKNTMKDVLNTIKSSCAIPPAIVQNYINMEKKLCRPCIRSQNTSNIQCTTCNVVNSGGLERGDKSKYYIKSMEEAVEHLGQSVILRTFERHGVLTVMAPICVVEGEPFENPGDAQYRKRGIVMKRSPDASTVFFPTCSDNIACGHEQDTCLVKNVIFPGIKEKLVGTVREVATNAVRLIQPISISHKACNKIELHFEVVIFNYSQGTAM